MTRTFIVPGGRGMVVLSTSVLLHMYSHAQRSLFAKEAGGQLFSAVVNRPVVEVTHITGPNCKDRRGRHKLDWDIPQMNADRDAHFLEGRHVVGLWHTHPQACPTPSHQDEKTTRQFLDALEGNMEGFLQVIVGNKGTVPNIGVWLAHRGPTKSWDVLEELRALDEHSGA